jgi:hypothetical protein
MLETGGGRSLPDGPGGAVPVRATSGRSVPATLLETPSPDGRPADPVTGWVVLHGVTRPGRSHPSMVRFAQALATTGGRVLIPEIPEWTRLELAPDRAQEIIRGAVEWLATDPGTRSGGVVVVGFSFGAPQALLLASDPGLGSRVRGVVGWGGYADLARTFAFHLTGEHEWNGQHYRRDPDPYGRWVVGANALPLVAGFGDATPVADALRALAAHAGDHQIPAGDPALDSLKVSLRVGLPRRYRPLFDLFAPPAGQIPPADEARQLVEIIIPAARRAMPLLDPLRMIEGIRVPVRLLHARSDRLIPFTETLALADALERRAPDLKTGVTGLFGHSGGAGDGGPLTQLQSGAGFLKALRTVFETSA